MTLKKYDEEERDSLYAEIDRLTKENEELKSNPPIVCTMTPNEVFNSDHPSTWEGTAMPASVIYPARYNNVLDDKDFRALVEREVRKAVSFRRIMNRFSMDERELDDINNAISAAVDAIAGRGRDDFSSLGASRV